MHSQLPIWIGKPTATKKKMSMVRAHVKNDDKHNSGHRTAAGKGI